MSFAKGQKVYRYYTCEPAFLYGGGKHRENGEVIGDTIEWDGGRWVPVIWEYAGNYPSLNLESNVYPITEEKQP